MQNERLRHLNESLLEQLEKHKWELEVARGHLQRLQKESQMEQEQKDRCAWLGVAEHLVRLVSWFCMICLTWNLVKGEVWWLKNRRKLSFHSLILSQACYLIWGGKKQSWVFLLVMYNLSKYRYYEAKLINVTRC